MSLDVSLYVNADTGGKEPEYINLFSANITHNLGEMAAKANIYRELWRPEEIDIKYAKDLIKPLSDGLQQMKDNPTYFKKFNSPNGWGLYEDFIPWVEEYLLACVKHPKALVEASR